MAIAGGNITLDSTEGMDRITQTEKVTSPYHSDGNTTLSAASIITSSLTDTNETYFFGISKSGTATTEEWNVAFGSTNGFGSDDDANAIKPPTEAIYKQYASLLLAPTEVTGGFFISRNNSLAAVPTGTKLASGKDKEIFILSARRSNMKDRINKKTWSLVLSGSNTISTAGTILHLTDDSVNNTPISTPVGDRYNIVSGSGGTVQAQATDRTYGFFYPDMGIMVFSATELSASLPGSGSQKNAVTRFGPATEIPAAGADHANSAHNFRGFGTGEGVDGNKKFALRFVNCLQPNGAKLTFRDEEDQVSAQYFCRVRSGQMNFSNNPTFVSGSLNELRQSTMRGNPSTFISSVQLYNDAGDMVAVGNLSTPLKKNFSSEATIKVKLTY